MFSRLHSILILGLLLGGIAAAQDPPLPIAIADAVCRRIRTAFRRKRSGRFRRSAPLYRVGRARYSGAWPCRCRYGRDEAIDAERRDRYWRLKTTATSRFRRKNVRIAEFDLLAAKRRLRAAFRRPGLLRPLDRAERQHFQFNIRQRRRERWSAIQSLTAYIPNFGTQVTATFNNQRVTTDNPISILSPQFNSSLGFSITQPLFRGSGDRSAAAYYRDRKAKSFAHRRAVSPAGDRDSCRC